MGAADIHPVRVAKMSPTRRQFALVGGAAAILAGPRLAAAQDELPPNVFFSPCGQPFRAPMSAPYPVVDWFNQANKKGDGQLTHAEFVADAGAFFDTLDLNHHGVLDPFDIQVYEQKVAPEILGYRVPVRALAAPGFRLWLAQAMPGPGSGMGSPGTPQGMYDHEPENNAGRGPSLDVSGVGAAPYGFFSSPEPVTAADADMNGFVKKPEFLALADRHFTELDGDDSGYLTLERLPKTRVQQVLEAAHRRRS
jgi:hypothetical protein